MPTEEAGPSEQLPPGTFRDAAMRNIGTTDLWTPLVLSLPKQDRRNPIPAIIQQQAGQLRIKLDPIRITALARDYNRAWRESGLPAGDRRFDHQAQVTWFLQHQPQEERLKPGLNRRQKLALAGTAALAIATPIFAISRPNEVHLSSPPANPQNAPVEEPKPEPEVKSAESRDLFKEFLKPFIEEAMKKRAERAKLDPEYYHRVDRELNENRINLLLFGFGDTHEPPAAEKEIIGSPTVISYDMRSQKFDMVSLTHDIRAPEIERYRKDTAKPRKAIKVVLGLCKERWKTLPVFPLIFK